MLRTHGAFHRDPLYNNLQLRKVNVSCDVELLASLDDVKNKNEKELMEIVNNAFTFDNYKWQQENKIVVFYFILKHVIALMELQHHCQLTLENVLNF